MPSAREDGGVSGVSSSCGARGPKTSSVQPASDLIHPHGPESWAGRGCRPRWWEKRTQGWEEHRAARGMARSPGGMCRVSLQTAALSSPPY